MPQPTVYLITGRPCSGKSTLAAWLCRRLPRPLTGLRTLCTGRCPAGPLFSLQELSTGRVTPVDGQEGEKILPYYRVWDTEGASTLRRARAAGRGTVLVDEALPPRADCPAWSAALEELLHSGSAVVVTAPGTAAAALEALCPPETTRRLDLDQATPEACRAALEGSLPLPLHPGVSVRLFREEKCFGPGPLQMLELVGRTGSLHQAAAAMGMAYSKAWKLLNHLEAQWGFPMLERHPGGSGGGGSLLTPLAWELLGRYRALRWETERAAEDAFARWFDGFCTEEGQQGE